MKQTHILGSAGAMRRAVRKSRPMTITRSLRRLYIGWLLRNAEADAQFAEAQAKLYRDQAQVLRVELSLLGVR